MSTLKGNRLLKGVSKVSSIHVVPLNVHITLFDGSDSMFVSTYQQIDIVRLADQGLRESGSKTGTILIQAEEVLE